MIGITNRCTGQIGDDHNKRCNARLCLRTFLLLSFFSSTLLLGRANAEEYVGCLLNEDVCDENETCFDDFAFGRCVSDLGNDDLLYRFPEFSAEDETLLEAEMSRLYDGGFVWTDDYTQCVLQTALAAIKDATPYDIELCETLLTDTNFNDDIDEENETPEQGLRPAEDYVIVTEPKLLNQETTDEIYNPTLNQQTNEDILPSIDLRDVEEPLELEGIEEVPLQRSKFYQTLLDNDQDEMMVPYTIEEDPYIDQEHLLPLDPEDQLDEGQDETLEDNINYLPLDQEMAVFDRQERMDVKKPGPFFEASPNNFYLDKLSYKYDTEDDYEPEERHNSTTAQSNDEQGQQEYEFPMSTSTDEKEKRDILLPTEKDQKDYVHIALNNEFQRWREGSDFINALAWELGLPEHALSDRTIEKQHVQFKVEPNEQDLDAIRIADALNDDISIQKRLTDTLGVNIAQAAAGEKEDRVSVFPHGRNLNLLILVVVGASATASLLVGGLIYALASRRRCTTSKKVSKLQLSDDVEEKGKLQEEYKQLCRDWSKTSTTAEKKPVSANVTKVQSQESNGSTRSSTSSWSDEPANNSMDISTGHMVLAYMEDHLKNKQRLEQEWVGLCGYEAEPCSTAVAFKAENKKKNRYPDKLPYDHNRVILNALVNANNSDYINASTVTDHDPRNPSYIVTQGPLGQTVADFWQMVWEQGCVVIVMLTRLQDNGYQLCTRYWPEEGSEQYHIFEVHLVSEHVWCEDYLVRSVYLKNTRTGETRTVTQFHFRSWPAHGVPSSTKALLEFRRKVNKSYRGRSCPIVVHCSDGVGRSGTYALIDMVLNRLSKGCKEIDIAATLEHIRDQRGGMVQNRQQFEFCLMAVAEEVHAILKALPQ